MKIAYLFDSGSNYLINNSKDCFVANMLINVKENDIEKSYKDTFDLSRDELIQKLNSKLTITTSQPVIGELYELVDEIYKKYDLIIAIPFSKHLSSTFSTILSLQNEYGKNKFLVADIDAMGITGNWFLNEIQEHIKSKKIITQEELDLICQNTRSKICGAVIVTNVNRLIAGGRLKSIKGLIAKTLKLKLIIKYKGNLEFKDKSLSLRDAIDKTLNIIDNDCQFRKNGIKNCSILIELSNKEESQEIHNYILNKLNLTNKKVSKSLLPCCVISHTGYDTCSILIESK